MSDEKKPYLTTDQAGYFVAGQRIPSRPDKDGNRTPKVGFQLMLTDAEAKYELLQGVIEPVKDDKSSAPLAPPSKPSKAGETAVKAD